MKLIWDSILALGIDAVMARPSYLLQTARNEKERVSTLGFAKLTTLSENPYVFMQ
jgi:hypothetical protein